MHFRPSQRVCFALITTSALVLSCAAPIGVQAVAQTRTSEVLAPDSGNWSDGLEAGRIAGRKAPVAGRAAAAFIGGLPVGFFGLLALTDQDRVQVVGAGGGLAIVWAAAAMGRTDAPTGLVEGRGVAYSRGFAQGYMERLRARRRAAASVGGAVGAAAGLGLFLALLSRVGT